MSEKLLLLPDMMKKIARYEMTFAGAVELPDDYEAISECIEIREGYQMTLDDLRAAMRNLKEKDPTVGEFGDKWYFPIQQLSAEFGIDAVCDAWYYDHFDEDTEPDCIRGLPLGPEATFADIWCSLDDVWTEWEDDVHLSEIELFDVLVRDLEQYYAERELLVEERSFAECQKIAFISPFETDGRLKHASEAELRLCRLFTDDLCEKGSLTAMRLKAYACYGGNRLYLCDWQTSRELVARLYEKTDNPQYANTLGYIYYYGRCNGGQPEYEKALEMYTVAAANGLYEGMYKLADMYSHGHAVKKSPRTARKLYELVYWDSLKKFVEGTDGNFADAALRMGNVYLKGIDEEEDPAVAYEYFLQADLAIRRRNEHHDYYGDTTVAGNIRKSLEECRARIDPEYFQEFTEEDQPRYLFTLLNDNNRVRISVEGTEGGDSLIRMKRVPIHKDLYACGILLTEPRLDICEVTDEITYRAVDAVTSWVEGEKPLLIDYAEWDDDTEERLNLYFADVQVGWIECEKYRLYGPRKEAPSGRQVRLVSIRFQPKGQTYDYLCDDENVKVGDTVIVPGYEGDTEVEVVDLYTRYESQLGFPLERYKKALRKMER